MVKLKLDLQDEFNFTLIGIVTSEPIYRLGWLLNEALKINLSESETLQIYHPKKKAIQDFNLFVYKDTNETNYELIHNKGSHGLLVEEHKQIDYYLKASTPTASANKLAASIKAIKNISLVQQFEPSSLKSKNRLLFSIEED